MKKTITINLSGIVFNIEEDAFEKLNDYLESIKKHYGEDGQEIISDIESGISEKFQKKLGRGKQVITSKEVEEIIKVMGTVEEIGAEVEADAKETKKERIKREGVKKLYRDTDDVIVAGVCSGLAAYFGVDTVIVRVIFILLAFLNGFGILAYLVLWLVTPEALSSVQKLEMQGKPVNLKKLEQVVKKKSQKLKKEGKGALQKVSENKDSLKKVLELPIWLVENIFNFLQKLLRRIGPAFLIILGLGLLIGSVLAIFAVMLAIGMLIFNVDSSLFVTNFPLENLLGDPSLKWLFGSIFLVAVVPLIFILLLGVTLLRRKNVFSLGMVLLLIFIWFLGIVGVGTSGVKLVPTVDSIVQEVEKQKQMNDDYQLEMRCIYFQ